MFRRDNNIGCLSGSITRSVGSLSGSTSRIGLELTGCLSVVGENIQGALTNTSESIEGSIYRKGGTLQGSLTIVCSAEAIGNYLLVSEGLFILSDGRKFKLREDELSE